VAPWSVLKTAATLGMFLAKVLFFLFFFMWIRWTLPRFRYDQLMSLGWKFMLPLALAYIVIVASAVLALEALGLVPVRVLGMSAFGLALFALNIVLVILVLFLLDRGRLISPASARVRSEGVARLRAVSGRPGGRLPPPPTPELASGGGD
jgi:NADH-quinone oxidoreductase subunit H